MLRGAKGRPGGRSIGSVGVGIKRAPHGNKRDGEIMGKRRNVGGGENTKDEIQQQRK